MADRRPLATPGRIDEVPDGDRVIVSGIIRTEAGDLTFEDPVTGSKTLAELAAAGGGTIGGTTGSTAGLIVTATAVADEVESSAVDIADVSDHLADADIHVPALGSALQVLRVNAGATATEWATPSSGIGGSTGATDNRVLRADGTGGATVQASVVTIDDAGAVTGVTSLTASGAISGSNLSGTNTGDQTITLTGNVTGSGTGSFAATIANDAVTYAKMQNVSAASRLLGRGDSGSGDPEEITLGAGLSMSGTTLSSTAGGGSTLISPTSIGANQNNYSPTDWSTADLVRLTASGNYEITGFDSTATVKKKVLWNADSSDTLRIRDESGSSTAANRISLPDGADFYLHPDGFLAIQYDATSSRWRPVGMDKGPPMLLSQARRTTGALISSSSFIGFDSEVLAAFTPFVTFDSAGTWTVQRPCTLNLRATMTWQAATSGVGALVIDFRKNTSTVLQEQRSAAEQATDNYTTQTIEVAHTFAVGDTIRLYVTNFGGSPTTVANMQIVSIFYISG